MMFSGRPEKRIRLELSPPGQSQTLPARASRAVLETVGLSNPRNRKPTTPGVARRLQ